MLIASFDGMQLLSAFPVIVSLSWMRKVCYHESQQHKAMLTGSLYTDSFSSASCVCLVCVPLSLLGCPCENQCWESILQTGNERDALQVLCNLLMRKTPQAHNEHLLSYWVIYLESLRVFHAFEPSSFTVLQFLIIGSYVKSHAFFSLIPSFWHPVVKIYTFWVQ